MDCSAGNQLSMCRKRKKQKSGLDTKKHKEPTIVMLLILLGSNGNSEILYNIHVHVQTFN
jgi:hypothetical protein